jgi:hypothetical protein
VFIIAFCLEPKQNQNLVGGNTFFCTSTKFLLQLLDETRVGQFFLLLYCASKDYIIIDMVVWEDHPTTRTSLSTSKDYLDINFRTKQARVKSSLMEPFICKLPSKKGCSIHTSLSSHHDLTSE